MTTTETTRELEPGGTVTLKDGTEVWLAESRDSHGVRYDGELLARGGFSGTKIHRGTPGTSVLGCGKWVKTQLIRLKVDPAAVTRDQLCERCFPAHRPESPEPAPAWVDDLEIGDVLGNGATVIASAAKRESVTGERTVGVVLAHSHGSSDPYITWSWVRERDADGRVKGARTYRGNYFAKLIDAVADFDLRVERERVAS